MKNIILLIQAVVIIVNVHSQYTNWDCNHLSDLTIGVCYTNSATSQYLAKCNGTNTAILEQFSDGSCGTSSSNPSSITAYNESSDTSDFFACDKDYACGHAIVRYYSDEHCSGDLYTDLYYIVDECYEMSSTSSFLYYCTDSSIIINAYDQAGCTGNVQVAGIDYESYNDDLTGCYDVCNMCGFNLFCFLFCIFCDHVLLADIF